MSPDSDGSDGEYCSLSPVFLCRRAMCLLLCRAFQGRRPAHGCEQNTVLSVCPVWSVSTAVSSVQGAGRWWRATGSISKSELSFSLGASVGFNGVHLQESHITCGGERLPGEGLLPCWAGLWPPRTGNVWPPRTGNGRRSVLTDEMRGTLAASVATQLGAQFREFSHYRGCVFKV